MNVVENLIGNLAEKAAADAVKKRDASTDYPSIIHRAASDESEPGDAKRLGEIIGVLGLSARDVRDDLDCLRVIEQAKAECPSDQQLAEAQPVAGKLYDQIESERLAFVKRQEELRDQARAATARYRELEKRQAASRKKVADLKADHPRLFPQQRQPELAQPAAPAPVNVLGHVRISSPPPATPPAAQEAQTVLPGDVGFSSTPPSHPGIGRALVTGVRA